MEVKREDCEKQIEKTEKEKIKETLLNAINKNKYVKIININKKD